MSSIPPEPQTDLLKPRSYPGIAQSLGLLILALFLGFTASLVFYASGFARGPAAEFKFEGWVLIGVNTVAFLGASLVGWVRSRRSFRSVFPLYPFSKGLVLPILVLAPAALVVLNLVTTTLLELAPTGGVETLLEEMMRELLEMLMQNRPAALVAVVFMAPITEEVFFRGLLLQGFLRRYSPVKAIWATTLLFALAHFNPVQLPATLVLGAYLGWLTYRVGSLWPAMLAHGANNLMALLATWTMGPEKAEAMGSGPWFLNVAAVVTVLIGVLWVVRAAGRSPKPGFSLEPPPGEAV